MFIVHLKDVVEAAWIGLLGRLDGICRLDGLIPAEIVDVGVLLLHLKLELSDPGEC